ncbi:MAG: PspC domain-containing protein [Peptococcaceae bacterium]|nr:PspC domain-containing protein [Peptococcaceae bacterium]
MTDKRLTKSTADKKIDGVCGGIAQYFDVDSTLVRVAWIIFACIGGSGMLAYILAAVIMPRDITRI